MTPIADDPVVRRFVVEFTRIGTRRGIPPLPVDAVDLDGVADRIAAYAKAFRLPGNPVAVIDPPGPGVTSGVGTITVGGRNAGDFTWAEQTP